MATVGEIVSWALREQATGYSREDVTSMLDEAHRMLFKHECAQTMYMEETNAGWAPPILETQDQVYTYQGPVGTWRVSMVALRGDRYYNQWIDTRSFDYGYTESPLVNASEYVEAQGNYYYPFNFIDTLDAVDGGRPQIRFSRNPGAYRRTTDQSVHFYMISYRTPTTIASDRQSLDIPDSDGAHRRIVFPALMKLIEGRNQGNYVEALEYINGVLRPQAFDVLNHGEHGKRHATQPRPY